MPLRSILGVKRGGEGGPGGGEGGPFGGRRRSLGGVLVDLGCLLGRRWPQEPSRDLPRLIFLDFGPHLDRFWDPKSMILLLRACDKVRGRLPNALRYMYIYIYIYPAEH